jgi:hypothetical protein
MKSSAEWDSFLVQFQPSVRNETLWSGRSYLLTSDIGSEAPTMFCDRCGRELESTAQFCSACGKAMADPASPNGPQAARVHKHLKTLAALWIVYGILRLLEAVWVLAVGRMVVPQVLSEITGSIAGFPTWLSLEGIVKSGLLFAGAWSGVLGAIELFAAWGLMERRPWARILVLIFGFLVLWRFPFGTALGIYTIWVLLPTPSGHEYEGLIRAS